MRKRGKRPGRRRLVRTKLRPPAPPKTPSSAERKKRHPIDEAVDRTIHAVLDVRESFRTYIPLAEESRGRELAQCVSSIEAWVRNDESREATRTGREINDLRQTVRRLKRSTRSRAPKVLRESLYIYLFSAFDKFVGDIVAALFSRRPELFSGINRSIELREIAAIGDVDQVKSKVLASEIEDLRRQSYLEQFKWFEKFFDVSLRGWVSFPKFIEASQRRNLYVHNDGHVSAQYLSVCDVVSYKFDARPEEGSRLELSDEYFEAVCDLMLDAAVMLAHTLWRKVLPDEIEVADDGLRDIAYEFLQKENWQDGRRVGEFAVAQKKISKDLSRRIAVINLAIAMKFDGDDGYASLLAGYDWSSCLPEFALALAVLADDFDQAAALVIKIGEAGELISEHGYYDWPLFREFRNSEQFRDAFRAVYGRAFQSKAEEVAEEAVQQVEADQQVEANQKAAVRSGPLGA